MSCWPKHRGKLNTTQVKMHKKLHKHPLCVHTAVSFLRKNLRNSKKMRYFAPDFRKNI